MVTENTTLFHVNLKDVALNRLNSCLGVEWLMTSGSACVQTAPCKDSDSDAMCDVMNAMKLDAWLKHILKKIGVFRVPTSHMTLSMICNQSFP